MLDSQNKERRRQETHYYALEVGISVVSARFKANFSMFRLFQSVSTVSVTSRNDPIWPIRLDSGPV